MCLRVMRPCKKFKKITKFRLMLIIRPQRIHADNKECNEFENISNNISVLAGKETLYKF
jgi:hypothetical protein